MPSQKATFLQSEGDAYHSRNVGQATPLHDRIAPALQALNIAPRRILEIGCGDGTGLDDLRRAFNAECHGITPGHAAVEYAGGHYPALKVVTGTADDLSAFATGSFDLVVFGFCLYLCDPEDYGRIVSESDRVLAKDGTLVIADFFSKEPKRNPFSHRPGVFSYKRDFAQLWIPAFRLLSHATYGDGDDCEAVSVLGKHHGTPTDVM